MTVNDDMNALSLHPSCLPDGWSLSCTYCLDDIASDWKKLSSVANVSPFETYDWLSAWYQYVGQYQTKRLSIFILSNQHHDVIAIFPLAIYAEKYLNIMRFMGGEITDYRAPIVHPDCWQTMSDAQFMQLWSFITASVSDIDVVEIKRMKASLSGHANPLCLLSYVKANEQAHAALLPDHYETFQETRKSKLFADIRRQKKRLMELGELNIVTEVRAGDYDGVIQALQAQKSQRWLATGSRDFFAEQGYLAFYQHFLSQAQSEIKVVMSAVQMNHEWIATHWGINDGKTFYWILPTYDSGQWERYSAGKILLDAMVQWSIEQGLTVFDLTVGDEAYKQLWANRTESLYAGAIGVSFKGRCFLKSQHILTQLKQKIKQHSGIYSVVKKIKQLIANK